MGVAGRRHSASDSASPEGKIKAIAKEYMAKDPELTEAKAVTKAWESHEELYKQYNDEHPAQRGR